jgi:hypothetical protein
MATKYWLGDDSGHEGDLNVAANWSPSGVPEAGDSVVFDGRSTENVTDNLDALEALDLAGLTVWSGYTGTIGSSGSTPMITHCTSGTVYLAGTGVMRLQCGAGAEETTSINLCVINSSGSAYLSSQANDADDYAVWTEVRVHKGNVYILGDSEKSGASGHGGDSGTIVGTLKVMPTSTATVRVGDQCINKAVLNTPVDVIVKGGTLDAHSDLGYVQTFGGTVNYGSTTIDMGNSDDITSLIVNGGTFYWKPQSSGSISTSPTITSMYVASGTFDATDMKETGEGGDDPVITTVWQYGGTVDLRNVYANFDITTYYNEGGSLHYSPGQQLGFEGGA